MSTLDRSSILGFNDAKVIRLHVPEWGGDCFIRTLTGGERDSFEASCLDNKTGKATKLVNYRARFAALVLSDETGKPLFDASDVTLLAKKNAAALDRILDAGLALNGMSKDSIESAEENS